MGLLLNAVTMLLTSSKMVDGLSSMMTRSGFRLTRPRTWDICISLRGSNSRPISSWKEHKQLRIQPNMVRAEPGRKEKSFRFTSFARMIDLIRAMLCLWWEICEKWWRVGTYFIAVMDVGQRWLPGLPLLPHKIYSQLIPWFLSPSVFQICGKN